MDDHFWPSVYPGIIVGLLLGLSERSLPATFLGAFGGLVGALATFYLVTYFEMEQGIFPVVGIILGAALLAKIFMMIGIKIIRALF